MCSEKTIKAIEEGKVLLLTKWHLMIGLILLVSIQIIAAATWKANIDHKIEDHEKRIELVETVQKKNHDILLELRFNMIELMKDQGLQYTEIGNIK